MASVWMVAYRVGFSEGRLTIPLRMIAALSEHEVCCEGADPAQTANDLVEQLGLPENEAKRLVDQAQASRAQRSPGLRSA